MKRAFFILIMSVLMVMSGFAQNPDENRQEQMIYAQLKYIMEKAELTKREYSKFSKIYVEYQKSLLELNSQNVQRSAENDFHNPHMPFAPGNPGKEYFEKWEEINNEYLKQIEKIFPEEKLQKIGQAQFELNQKIWNRWSQETQRDFRRNLGAYGMMGFNMEHPNFFVAPNVQDIQYWLHGNPQEQERLKQQREYWQQHPEEFKEFQKRVAEQQQQNQERWNNLSGERNNWNQNFRRAWHLHSDSDSTRWRPQSQFNPFAIPQK